MADVQDEHRRDAVAAMVQHATDAGVYDVMLEEDYLVADAEPEPERVLGCPLEHLHRVPDCCAPTCWCK